MGNAKHKKTFYLKDGKTFSDLKGFAKELARMPKDVYEHHVSSEKNDFSNWLKFSMNKEDLGKKIEKQVHKIELELEVLRHLVHDAGKKPVPAKAKSPKKPTVKVVKK